MGQGCQGIGGNSGNTERSLANTRPILDRRRRLGGLALGVYALVAFDGTTLAMVALSGAEIFGAGLRAR
jgi:hypothetical protein